LPARAGWVGRRDGPLMPPVVVAALALTGAVLLWTGAALVLRTSARGSGVLLAAAGILAVLGSVLAPDRVGSLAAFAAGQLLGLAVIAYPRTRPQVATAVAAVSVLAIPVVVMWALPTADGIALAAMVVMVVPLLHLWWRLERSPGEERIHLAWMMAATLPLAFLGWVLAMLTAPAGVVAGYVLCFSSVGWAAWTGVQPRAVDVRGVIAGLAVSVVGLVGVFTIFQLAMLAAEVVGAAPHVSPWVGVIAAASATALAPLRRQLALVADEVLFGTRPDPLTAAEHVAHEVGEDPTTALGALREALVLPYAELRLDGVPIASSGEPVDYTDTVPVTVDGRRVGDLVVGRRPGDLRLPPEDAKVLALVGPLLAQTARARAAREASTTAREEERRRLRRDLHDGLGPRLSGIGFTVDAALLSLTEPGEAARHLNRARSEAVAAIREIRELVYGLRPSALDEVGLVEAIRLQAATLPLHVEVAAGELPPLTAAVEVAAYRIAVEALTNSARHSGADRAICTLTATGHTLSVEVTDGASQGDPWKPGVGLTSIRERARELGGSVDLAQGRVRATLPLHPGLGPQQGPAGLPEADAEDDPAARGSLGGPPCPTSSRPLPRGVDQPDEGATDTVNGCP
jgi:two-component system NarL family sensor kinase